MERDEDDDLGLIEDDDLDRYDNTEREVREDTEREVRDDTEREVREDTERGVDDDEYDRSDERCAFHGDRAAELDCDRCGRPICDGCINFLEHKRLCPSCARSRGGVRLVKRLLTATLIVGMVGAAVFYFSRSLGTFRGLEDDDPFDYGQYKPVVEKQREHLAQNPCDQKAMVSHAETLLDAGNHQGLLTRAEQFFAKCGSSPTLRRKVYVAHTRLGQWDRAMAEAAALVEEAPDGHDSWFSRGEAHAHAGRLEEAAADYRKAIEIDPRHPATPLELASVLERLARPCEAIPVLEQSLEHHLTDRSGPKIDARLGQLRQAASCRAPDSDKTKGGSRPGKARTR